MDVPRCTCIILCMCLASFVAARRYDGYKVIRITPQKTDEVAVIKSVRDRFDLDFWSDYVIVDHPINVMAPPDQVSDVISILDKHGIRFEITMEDIQYEIDKQMADFEGEATDRGPIKLSRFDYSSYHTMPAIDAWMDSVVETYPNLTEIFTVTYSYEGRPIRGIKIRKPASYNKSCAWFEGGIHGREWVSPSSMLFMIKEMVENYGVDPVVTKMIDSLDWYIVPVLNVDGYIYTFVDRLWRKDRSPNNGSYCVGTDLNRNWSFEWGGPDSQTNPCFVTYRGTGPASTVEVTGTENYLRNLSDKLVLFVDWHSFSQLWMAPWSYTPKVNEFYEDHMKFLEAAVTKLQSVYGTKYRYGPVYEIIYSASGASLDFVFGELGVKHSYAVELRDKGYYGFLLPKTQIIPTCIEAWESAKAGVMYLLEEEGI
ncbi:carboxypeptidase B-like [Saccoglossus kowalevskii]|uniref:Carboxypeptidase A1-like n=1 Tax=Saccoglossus kowalevskii TaxID=10224 RepID=A0ABM0GJV1_SACKO|nr:PREDICTED: carboxypeptidase A1-like [Saccoglossus kowalevskii]